MTGGQCDQIEGLTKENAALRALVAELQFSAYTGECPCCGANGWYGDKHEADCRIAAALEPEGA